MRQTEFYGETHTTDRPSTGQIEELVHGPKEVALHVIDNDRVERYDTARMTLCSAVDLLDEFDASHFSPDKREQLDRFLTEKTRDFTSHFSLEPDNPMAPIPPSFKDMNVLCIVHDAVKENHLTNAMSCVDATIEYIFAHDDSCPLLSELKTAYFLDQKSGSDSCGVMEDYKRIYQRFGRSVEVDEYDEDDGQ